MVGESPSAALVELEVDYSYPRFEFARITVGAERLMDYLHVHLHGGWGAGRP